MIRPKQFYMCQKMFWSDPHNKAMEKISRDMLTFRDLSTEIAKVEPDTYSQRISGELVYKTKEALFQPSDLGFRLNKKKLKKQAQQIKDFIEQMRNSINY